MGGVESETTLEAARDVVIPAAFVNLERARSPDALFARIEPEHHFAEAQEIPLAGVFRLNVQRHSLGSVLRRRFLTQPATGTFAHLPGFARAKLPLSQGCSSRAKNSLTLDYTRGCILRSGSRRCTLEAWQRKSGLLGMRFGSTSAARFSRIPCERPAASAGTRRTTSILSNSSGRRKVWD